MEAEVVETAWYWYVVAVGGAGAFIYFVYTRVIAPRSGGGGGLFGNSGRDTKHK